MRARRESRARVIASCCRCSDAPHFRFDCPAGAVPHDGAAGQRLPAAAVLIASADPAARRAWRASSCAAHARGAIPTGGPRSPSVRDLSYLKRRG
ncbi:hypothetical protein Bamb_4518 [Burkholderia ambifaria AMMD]|uniref:Uncharacterized protein n=1 Tax=Burkholderia ambifaria (strain ATCC BAA-244 / DSM 16087 / CCUG 44356 / LMG 19182 / AMMD) TaxID=339670 RepID=Q0B705_BURCM|nr:hypothetical protein Bamb_4518 [Burkholderia ambifaria AMMD]